MSTVPETTSMPRLEPQWFEAILLQLPDAVIYADRDGIVRIWNRGAERVFGFAANEVVGQSLDVIIPQALRPAHWSAFRRAIDDGRTRHGGEVRTTRSLHKDGRRLYVDLSFGLVIDAAGAVVGAVAVGRDAGERHLAQQAPHDRLAALAADRRTT